MRAGIQLTERPLDRGDRPRFGGRAFPNLQHGGEQTGCKCQNHNFTSFSFKPDDVICASLKMRAYSSSNEK